MPLSNRSGAACPRGAPRLGLRWVGPSSPPPNPPKRLLPLQVSMQYNPGWNNSSVNLLHVQAVGPSDTLHYVWSSIGAPAVLLVATESRSSVLRVNWTQLLSPAPSGAVWIDPPSSVVYSAAIVFTKVALREVAPLRESCPVAEGGAGAAWGRAGWSAAFPAAGKWPLACPTLVISGLSCTGALRRLAKAAPFGSPSSPWWQWQPVDRSPKWWCPQHPAPLPFLLPRCLSTARPNHWRNTSTPRTTCLTFPGTASIVP